MFRMLRVFNIVGRVQNIVPKRYYSFVQSSEADQRNRLSDYTLTKDGLKSLSRFFEVKPKLLATVQYSDEIAWDSLNGESFVLLASGKQQECLDNITSNVGSLSCDDLILMLIAIDSLEIPLHYRVFDAIQMEIKKRLSECPFDKNGLNSLANLSAFLNKRRDHINKFFIGAELHSNAMKILPQCSSLDEISKISQCIGNMNILTTLQNFLDYKGVVSKIFAAERVDWLKDGSKIFNILNLLNFRPWSFHNVELVKTILHTVKNSLPHLRDGELASIAYALQVHMEPAYLSSKILSIAEERLQDRVNLDLLYCCSSSEIPAKNDRVTPYILQAIESTENISTSYMFFQIIRKYSGSSNLVFHKYWEKIGQELQMFDKSTGEYSSLLNRISHRYSFFDHGNENGAFEKLLTTLIMEDFESGLGQIIPKYVASLSPFLLGIGYFHMPEEFRYKFVNKIIGMQEQYTAYDILRISRGVELCLRRSRNPEYGRNPSGLRTDLCRIDNMLDSCVESRLKQSTFNANTLLIRSLGLRKASKNTAIFHQLTEMMSRNIAAPDLELSSSLTVKIVRNLETLNYMSPRVCDEILRYIFANRENIKGEVIYQTLFFLHLIGYDPENPPLLMDGKAICDPPSTKKLDFSVFEEIIERDFEMMSCIQIIRVATALCYFGALPTKLIERIFDQEFLKRSEDEVKRNLRLFRNNMPQNTLTNMMELNRIVCMDYPEAGLPWFQRNFIEANINSIKPQQSQFYSDVHKLLLTCVGDKDLIQTDFVSPYGYRIPFVIYLNSNNEVVRRPPKEDFGLRKFAVLLLENGSYCVNSDTVLRGQEKLKQRHLEMLGFSVIQIQYRDWNKTQMNLPNAKQTFLKKMLKII